MASIPNRAVTKTHNPLHFEDLEPHRFEDLVRQLIYDFKDWQSIEATGQAGSDEGFDIRAWERNLIITNKEDEESDEEVIGEHPMDGNLWMVQCKREKAIGPAKVVNIINDGVNASNPPWGYILVAPVNFSKKSYDAFRNTLRSKGVSEFYLWGRAELEDMLSLPKNDHVLFTFFGISLVTRRRSRSTERKFIVNNKNKLLRILSNGSPAQEMYQSLLIRDIKDEHYPYEGSYKDFDQFPRWQEHIAFAHHPMGLLFHLHKYYAYIDQEKKVFDYTEAVDLVNRQCNHKEHRRPSPEEFEKRDRVTDFWQHLPRINQAEFIVDSLLPFGDMLVIDDKGDAFNTFPHIFMDFPAKPSKDNIFPKSRSFLKYGNEEIKDDGYTRKKIFPQVFPEIKYGKIYITKPVEWDKETLRVFQMSSEIVRSLFDVDGKYEFLNPCDVILVAGAEDRGEKKFIKITQKYKTTLADYLKINGGISARESIERQVGRRINDGEQMTVFEFERIYEWALKLYTPEY